MFRQCYPELLLFGCVVVAGTCTTLPARSEPLRVIPDGTTQTVISGQANCASSCTITGISRSDNNLFHSFEKFSIPENSVVTFEDSGATNIFARVSGEASIINGAITVTGEGQANFFLINPAGIFFGSQSRVETTGSFIASTANSIFFSDGTEFAASSAKPPTLTVSTPIGLQFGSQSEAIVNRSQNGLTSSFSPDFGTGPEKTIALVGGSILFDGGRVATDSSQIQIGSVAKHSYVSLSPDFSLGYEDVVSFKDIQLRNGSYIYSGGNRGGITIRGENIGVIGGSPIVKFKSGNSSAGNITLIASESVEINSSPIIFLAPFGSGKDSVDIDINARTVTVASGGTISTGNFGSGIGGSVEINASEQITIKGVGQNSPTLITTSTEEGLGTGGNLTLNTQRLVVEGGAQVQAVTYGPGTGGNLRINASDYIEVRGTVETAFSDKSYSGLLASSGVEGLPFQPIGTGGNILINTGELRLGDGARVAVSSLGRGDAGNLEINARTVKLDSNAQLSAAANFGNGGNIQLENLDALVLRRGSTVSTRAGTGNGQGNGGNISIDANFIVAGPVEDSDIVAKATRGRGGNISITTRGLYDIAERRAILNNGTNDIDASSEFGISGTTSINQTIVKEDQEFTVNGTEQVALDTAVAEGCSATGNRFTASGRGGAPTRPTDPVNLSTSLIDLGDNYERESFSTIASKETTVLLEPLEIANDNSPAELANNQALVLLPTGLIDTEALEDTWTEASGWTTNEKAQVVLVSQPHRGLADWRTSARCAG